MEIEELPDGCLPPPEVIEALLRGPKIVEGRIVSDGPWNGMTPEEVLAERDAFNRACE